MANTTETIIEPVTGGVGDGGGGCVEGWGGNGVEGWGGLE